MPVAEAVTGPRVGSVAEAVGVCRLSDTRFFTESELKPSKKPAALWHFVVGDTMADGI